MAAKHINSHLKISVVIHVSILRGYYVFGDRFSDPNTLELVMTDGGLQIFAGLVEGFGGCDGYCGAHEKKAVAI